MHVREPVQKGAILILLIISLAGCASSLMAPAVDQIIAPVQSDRARIIFLRPSSYGGGIQASLFDVTGSEIHFLGIISVGTKVLYDVAPGDRRLMVVSESADFMEASLAPGLTYYAVVTPRPGAWKARFSLWPIKAKSRNEFNLGNEELIKWLEDAELVVKTPAAEQWFAEHSSDIRKRQSEYLAVWDRKTPEALIERTLEERDGVTR